MESDENCTNFVIPRTIGFVPRREKNVIYRGGREHLTEPEAMALVAGARSKGRNGDRDGLMVILAYRHGLRVGELVSLRWEQFDLEAGTFHVRRSKGGRESTHTLPPDEIRSLKRHKRSQPPQNRHLFSSELGRPVTTQGFARMLSRAAKSIDLQIKVHPHMLRHGCGYMLANRGQDTRMIQNYLGHQNIQHTVRYTELAPNRLAAIAQLWSEDPGA